MADAEFLLRVLRIAADDEDLDPDRLGFAVITAACSDGDERGWTLADAPSTDGLWLAVPRPEPHFWPFRQGEILVLPGISDREPFGMGRKPAKWDVGVEWFGHDYDAAKRRSDEVKAAPARDALADGSRP